MADLKYNKTYFDGDSLIFSKEKIKVRSFKHYITDDGIVIGLFQGNRGDRPDIDFIIKFLLPGEKKRLRTPKHIHWVVDLLLKAENNKIIINNLIEDFIDFYEKAPQFTSVIERNNYNTVLPSKLKTKYKNLEHEGTYSIDYIAYLIELFTICEKVSPREKKMFVELLKTIKKYCNGERDFFQVIDKASPGFKG